MVVELFYGAKRPETYSSLLLLETVDFCWVPEMLGFGFTALNTNVRRNNAPLIFAPLAIMT